MGFPSSISELRTALDTGKVSAVAIIKASIDKINTHNTRLNSIITTTFEQALQQAEAIDKRLQSGEKGALLGVPIVHKDLFCTSGVRTSCASKMLDNFIAPYSATMVERLEQAGCIMLGKSNMDEFAMGSSNEHSFYGPATNPWNDNFVTGGSSGGSAAAVAADFCFAASGSDTGGSIRQPASFCGVTGIKPTYGRISRYGMISYASSLDTGGFFARNAIDMAELLQVVAGPDGRDATCSNEEVPNYRAQILEKDLRIKTIGIPMDMVNKLSGNMARLFSSAVSQLEKVGVKVIDVKIDLIEHMIATYYIIACAEASSNLSRYDGVRYGHRSDSAETLEQMYSMSRAEAFGYEVKKRILLGTYVLSANYYDAYYMRALRLRRLIKNSFTDLMGRVDAIFMPTTPSTAFALDSKSDNDMYIDDIFTVPANLVGMPAISFPIGQHDGLPVGAQLLGNYFSEGHLLQLTHQFQLQSDWHKKIPDLKS